MGVFEEVVGGEIVDRDRNHEPVRLRPTPDAALPNGEPPERSPSVRFLDIPARAEQLARRGKRLRSTSATIRGGPRIASFEPSEVEQVTAMTLSLVIGMNGDPVDERAGGPLGADQDADRVGAREGDHAAAAPDLEVADRPLERDRRHRRLVGKVRRPAAIQRVDEQLDVIRAAEAVRRHRQLPTSNCQLPGTRRCPRWELAVGNWDADLVNLPSAPVARWRLRTHLVEIAAPVARQGLLSGRSRGCGGLQEAAVATPALAPGAV